MYTNEMSFAHWSAEAGDKSRALVRAINEGKILYDKWYQLTYGKTNAEIAAMSQMQGRTEADISAMAYALGVLNEMYQALNNGVVAQANRIAYLTPVL
jgi:hypothetical protein